MKDVKDINNKLRIDRQLLERDMVHRNMNSREFEILRGKLRYIDDMIYWIGR